MIWPVLRINYVFLVPWIILGLPSTVLFGQTILVLTILSILGVAGMFTRNPSMVVFTSASLLLLIVWGKIAGDLFRLPAPDSALLLLEFMLVILLLEASRAVLILDDVDRRLAGKTDEFSLAVRFRTTKWARTQLVNLGGLTFAAIGLSLSLLVFGSITSVSLNQLAFGAVLPLAAVIAILVLLTYRREPERRG